MIKKIAAAAAVVMRTRGNDDNSYYESISFVLCVLVFMNVSHAINNQQYWLFNFFRIIFSL